MRPRIRPFDDRDAEALVDLSLRAWAPVFASLERVLGSDIFGRLHPDWREDQRRAVEDVLAAKKGQVWVAEIDASSVVGFVSVGIFDAERDMGEISMLAVDPDYQGGSIVHHFGDVLGHEPPAVGLLQRLLDKVVEVVDRSWGETLVLGRLSEHLIGSVVLTGALTGAGYHHNSPHRP